MQPVSTTRTSFQAGFFEFLHQGVAGAKLPELVQPVPVQIKTCARKLAMAAYSLSLVWPTASSGPFYLLQVLADNPCGRRRD